MSSRVFQLAEEMTKMSKGRVSQLIAFLKSPEGEVITGMNRGEIKTVLKIYDASRITLKPKAVDWSTLKGKSAKTRKNPRTAKGPEEDIKAALRSSGEYDLKSPAWYDCGDEIESYDPDGKSEKGIKSPKRSLDKEGKSEKGKSEKGKIKEGKTKEGKFKDGKRSRGAIMFPVTGETFDGQTVREVNGYSDKGNGVHGLLMVYNGGRVTLLIRGEDGKLRRIKKKDGLLVNISRTASFLPRMLHAYIKEHEEGTSVTKS